MSMKATLTAKILAMATPTPCTKKALANIVFPKWNSLELQMAMFKQSIITKEQPEGCMYDGAEFRPVLRILGGKLFKSDMLDAYAWDSKRFAKFADKAQPLGTHSAAGLINLSKVILSITDPREQEAFADYMSAQGRDYLLVYTPAEERQCIKVTQELYDAGLTHCIDEWMNPDENGNYAITNLNVGDYLIVTDNGVYCIRKDEFEETHEF